MTDATTESPHRRRGWARALIVLSAVLAFAAILAVWANRQVLNTDNWTRTSTELLENRVIRNQVAAYMVDELYANVDVSGEIRQALPERLRPLAGPAAGGLRQLADRAAREVLSRPRAQALWADANRAAQLTLLKILEGGGLIVSTEGGDVVLDLKALLGQMQERVGVGGRVQARLPASAAQITVVQSDQLATAQTALKIVKGLPIVLIALSFALLAAALAIAPGWRREALRAYGIGLVLAGAAALIVQAQAGTALVDALARTAAVEPAAAAAWTIATTLLVQAAWATVGYGVFLFVAAWLAGPSRPAVAIRTVLAPYVRRPVIAYSGLAVLIVLLLWWAPTPATRDPVLALLLVVLLVLGAEALRRQIGREHPDANLDDSIQRLRERVRRGAVWAREGRFRERVGLAGRAEPVAKTENGASGGSVEDERLEQLERLGRLKESGVLDEHEFAAQKRLILDEAAEGPEPKDDTPPSPVLAPDG